MTIGGEPARYRVLMPLGAVAKLSFWIPVAILWAGGRTGGTTVALSCGDLVLAVAFLIAWRSTGTGIDAPR